MLSDASPFFFALIFVLALFSILVASTAFTSPSGLSKSRVTRAVRLNARGPNNPCDLPSIARERYTFLKNRNRMKRGSRIFGFLISIEELLIAANLKWRLSSFCIVILFIFFSLTISLKWIGKLDLIFALVLAGPSSVFVCLKFLVQRKARQLHKFQEIFPEALDLIVRSVRAGLPVSEAMKVIGSEVAEPVGEAFREVGANLAIGMSLDEALVFLQKKVPIPEVKFFVISLTIQQETGGNLAEILANLASIMRKRVQIGKKIRALSSEARASALIIGSLPFLVGLAIFVLNREYIEILFFDATGQIFLFGALGSITVGGFVMAKLVRFEI